ncbi:MAG: hypothetical protein OEQ53_05445, partial [Saprospiraceae bacterium]|nr:hypothetical protein [Saprospiraceae bacterium]
MGREDLYEDVRSNLSMSVFYMHPNGDVVTEASRRQDQYQAQSPHAYYYPYRYMSLLDHDTIFGAMVHTLEQELEPSRLSGNLIYFLEDPALSRRVPGGTLPMKYIRHFSHSDLVRIRDADTDATILAKNPAFFTMQKGGTVVQAVRFASAFFGKGQFVADTLIVQNGVFTLIQKLEGPYYQLFPIDSIPNDASWEKMPRDNRPTSEVQQLETRIEIQRVNDLFELDFTVSGTDHVPVAIELAFRKGGRLGGTESVGEIDQAFFLGEDMGTYKMDTFSITFGPGLHEHKWTQLRGADPKLDAISVYLTGYTPFHHRLTFE